MMFDIFAYRVTVDNRCDETGIPVTVKYPAAAMNAPPQCTRHMCDGVASEPKSADTIFERTGMKADHCLVDLFA